MGQRQLHLLASHMRLRPGATADQVRTFPHVLPPPLPPLPSIARFRVPARPPSARMASTLLRMRATALALSLYTTLCTHHLPLFVSRFLTGLNVSFTTRCGTQFGTQVSLLKMTQNDRNLIFSSAARAKTMHLQKITSQQSSVPLTADSASTHAVMQDAEWPFVVQLQVCRAARSL